MITKLSIWKNGTAEWEELPVYNRVEFDERLDEQLDSGSVQTISNSNVPLEGYSLYRIVSTDTDGTKREEYMFGFDTVETRGEGYHIHTIELVEFTRIIMGIPIDGCKVTQPIEGEKKSLFDVAYDLLLNKATLEVSMQPLGRKQIGMGGGENTKLLEGASSPEFHWECGTLLWECLCDIGNVINCIPRVDFLYITSGGSTRFVLNFMPVNDITAEYEL